MCFREGLFQQDNAKLIYSNSMASWLNSLVLDWPACSPDLSPEHFGASWNTKYNKEAPGLLSNHTWTFLCQRSSDWSTQFPDVYRVKRGERRGGATQWQTWHCPNLFWAALMPSNSGWDNIYHEIVKCVILSIWYIFYVLFWINNYFVRFANHYILFFSPTSTASKHSEDSTKQLCGTSHEVRVNPNICGNIWGIITCNCNSKKVWLQVYACRPVFLTQ